MGKIGIKIKKDFKKPNVGVLARVSLCDIMQSIQTQGIRIG